MTVGSTLADDDIVSLLQRCSPHDTDEVIKIMNAAAQVILAPASATGQLSVVTSQPDADGGSVRGEP